MSGPVKKFVIAKEKVAVSREILVEKRDVGVIKSEYKNHASIFFVRIWKQVELK